MNGRMEGRVVAPLAFPYFTIKIICLVSGRPYHLPKKRILCGRVLRIAQPPDIRSVKCEAQRQLLIQYLANPLKLLYREGEPMPSLVQYTCALLVVHQVEICITAAKKWCSYS